MGGTEQTTSSAVAAVVVVGNAAGAKSGLDAGALEAYRGDGTGPCTDAFFNQRIPNAQIDDSAQTPNKQSDRLPSVGSGGAMVIPRWQDDNSSIIVQGTVNEPGRECLGELDSPSTGAERPQPRGMPRR